MFEFLKKMLAWIFGTGNSAQRTEQYHVWELYRQEHREQGNNLFRITLNVYNQEGDLLKHDRAIVRTPQHTQPRVLKNGAWAQVGGMVYLPRGSHIWNGYAEKWNKARRLVIDATQQIIFE